MKHMNYTIAALMAITLGTGACVKKRPTRLAQGQGIDAQLVSAVDKQKFSLTTLAAIDGSLVSASDKEVEVADDMPGTMNKLPLVQYKTDSELLGQDLPLRGRPNFKYEIRLQLTDQYLRVLKVGLKKDLPFEEWPYAVRLEDGRLGVPMVGYRVNYFRIEHARNEDDRRTSRLIEVPVANFKSDATHYRIDRTSRTVFEALDKIDVFPASYFQGEWFYQATVVATEIGQESHVGRLQEHDVNFRQASRIRLDLTNKKALLGINLNRDERVRDDDRLNQGYVMSIPVNWKEFGAEANGHSQGLREEEIKTKEETKRPLIELKFAEVTTPGDDSVTGTLDRLDGRTQLADLKMTRDYFSFTILKMASGIKVRYALRRIDPNQQLMAARPYFEKDQEKFGYYTTTKFFEWDRRIQKRRDLEARLMMNRFDPKQEVVYRFSTETPKNGEEYGWVRELARYAIHFVDQGFRKAGTQLRVRLDESQDVDLGDLRYNVLHIINPIRTSNLSGYGPSVADSRNGQIISATTNLQLSGFLKRMADQVRAYMRQAGGLMGANIQTSPFTIRAKGSGNFGIAPFMAITVDAAGNSIRVPYEFYSYAAKDSKTPSKSQLLDFMTDENKRRLERQDGLGPIKNAEDALLRSRALYTSGDVSRLWFQEDNTGSFSAGAERLIERQIKAFCPEIDALVERVKNEKEVPTEVEHPIVESCVNKISRLPILTVTIHEILHNFGLMHNFAGSSETDPRNLWTADEIRRSFSGLNGEAFPEEFLPFNEVPKVSSVMDYGGGDSAEAPPVPGKYDIAAMRFIYADQVELKDGRLLSVNEKSGYRRLSDFEGQLREFRNCSDLEEYLGSDPMCAKWDTGSTPMQVVEHYIEMYWNDVMNSNYRYGREIRPGFGLENIYFRRNIALVRLKRFYDQWRFHLAEFVGQKDQYLERYNPEAYAQVLAKMKTSTLSEQYRIYKPVRDRIAKFLLEVAYMPNRYCVVQNRRGEVNAIEFSKLQGEISLLESNSYADSCNSKGIQDRITFRGSKFLAEVGHSLAPLRYSTAVRDMKEWPDVFGVEPDRLQAATMMSLRLDNSLIHQSRAFFPAITDEPDLRAQFLDQFLDRTLQGVDLTEQLKKSLAQTVSIKAPQTFPPMILFEAESKVLDVFGQLMQIGMMVPGKNEVNSNRRALFYSGQVIEGSNDHQTLAQKNAAFLDLGNGNLIYALPQNKISFRFISRLAELNVSRILSKSGLNVEEVNQALSPIISLFPTSILERMSAAKFLRIIQGIEEALGADRSVGTKLFIKATFQDYVTLFAAGGGEKLMDSFAKLTQAISQLKEQIAELEQSNRQAPELANLIQKLQESEATLAAITKKLEDQDLTEIFVNPNSAKSLPILQIEVRKRIMSAVADAQKIMDVDPQELDAQVNVLRSLL